MRNKVRKDGDEQFLTAAHCARDSQNTWYHAGYTAGSLGVEQQSLFTSGYDAVRIGLPDSQATSAMYNDGYVAGWQWPSIGMFMRQNQAMSNTISFTQVTDDWHCWT